MDLLESIPKSVLYVSGAISGACIIALVYRNSLTKKEKRSVPEGVVLLHQFPRTLHVPNGSPPCLKLETFLRMAEIPYECDFGVAVSSKGKCPWIEYNGQEVADSNFCVEFLSREFAVNVDEHLSAEECSIARAFQMMIEENTYWTLVRYRWVDDFPAMQATYEKTHSLISRLIFTNKEKRKVHGYLHGQGMGRHTREEIYSIAEKDLLAVSCYLAEKPFLMGDKPSLVDCAVFALLVNFLWQLPDCPQGSFIKSNLPNLVSYCKRMKERFYPDWNELITHPEVE